MIEVAKSAVVNHPQLIDLFNTCMNSINKKYNKCCLENIRTEMINEIFNV